MEDTIECYTITEKPQIEVDIEDLFKSDDDRDNFVYKLHKYDYILLFANGEKVLINMNQIAYVNNEKNYIEFVFSNLSRIIVFRDLKIIYQSPEYSSSYEVLYKEESQIQSEAQTKIGGVDRRDI